VLRLPAPYRRDRPERLADLAASKAASDNAPAIARRKRHSPAYRRRSRAPTFAAPCSASRRGVIGWPRLPSTLRPTTADDSPKRRAIGSNSGWTAEKPVKRR
jgi:hypothetical protein